MTDLLSCQSNAFYLSCLNNDLKNVRKTIKPSFINQIDPNGDTALHIACSRGYIELVQLLLRYHASQTIQNKEGLTAEQAAVNDEIKDLFKYKERSKSDSKHFVATTTEVEWFDSYKNAYRISYENREHMKQWFLKVPLKKLLDEIDIGYIEKIKFSSEKCKDEIKDYLQLTIEWEQPAGLIAAYTSGGTGFCTVLNYDLAEVGSNFRFISTQNLFNSDYLDNEAPKSLGGHIFAAILINHSFFKPYYRTNITTYRGMSISQDDLIEYKINDIVMTRTFLSTSYDENMAKRFIPINDNKKQPVLCIYKVKNPQTSLYIEELSIFSEGKEVLIIPFTVFRIKEIEDVDMLIDGKSCSIKVLKLAECDSNLL
ncbi:unnamed protein product [Rotaria sp. Silwood1]|nr:unnamed protein product [Rotaria sp. Silwood1]CAF3788006.1 unnamed protein product [Rotaria sp. Silwood1]CAF4718154.1 unnamed protein product [Rotaria sp. Silwood1]CAF4734000.1 unnamed protein product [Rotaria sp. Silwood1]